MAKSNNQKGKILYLEKILLETGENRMISMQEILTELMEYGINAERKSIYDDLEVLRSFGMDVRFRRGRQGGYYLAGQNAPQKEKTETNPENLEISPQNPEKIMASAASEKKGGKPLKLLCDNARREDVREYFGEFVQYKDKGDGYFSVTVQVTESPEFYGWLTAMGRDVRICKPKKAAQAYREYLKGLAKEYKGI